MNYGTGAAQEIAMVISLGALLSSHRFSRDEGPAPQDLRSVCSPRKPKKQGVVKEFYVFEKIENAFSESQANHSKPVKKSKSRLFPQSIFALVCSLFYADMNQVWPSISNISSEGCSKKNQCKNTFGPMKNQKQKSNQQMKSKIHKIFVGLEYHGF